MAPTSCSPSRYNNPRDHAIYIVRKKKGQNYDKGVIRSVRYHIHSSAPINIIHYLQHTQITIKSTLTHYTSHTRYTIYTIPVCPWYRSTQSPIRKI